MSSTALWMFSWCLVLYQVHAQNDTNNETDVMPFLDTATNRKVNITETCSKYACLNKCCPNNQILFLNQTDDSLQCVNITNPIHNDYSHLEIYDKDIKPNRKKIEEFTRIYSMKFVQCALDIEILFESPNHKKYILDDGTLKIRRLNYYDQWKDDIASDQYCVEHQFEGEHEGVPRKTQLVLRILQECDDVDEDFEPTEDPADTKNRLASYGMLVSCFFLVLVLAVYAALPQLRNLAGMMLMAYVATLIVAFVFRAVQVIGSNNRQLTATSCLYVGLIFYYSTLASFTWMNVMSFDIWWSMRGFRKLRQIHRRGILVKFGWYSLYGWGAPLIPVLFAIIVDTMDLTHLPNFIKPHIINDLCFMQEDERLFYMNGPILITTCFNIVLFLMTAYNIWRIKNGVTQHSAGESRRNKNDETRFGIYLKLSLVMGINWILEVVGSVYHPESVWWNIPDAFNSLIGVFIFIIFVLKRNIIALLCKRFSIESELIRKWQHRQPTDSVRTESSRSRLNSKGSKRKMQDSFTTDTSDTEEFEKKY